VHAGVDTFAECDVGETAYRDQTKAGKLHAASAQAYSGAYYAGHTPPAGVHLTQVNNITNLLHPLSPVLLRCAGQHEAAERLHSNFTAAWATWGWLPELFGADLSAVHPEDPGYNLRPEHIESTWYLKAVSGDPTGYYGGLAAAMMAVLNHSRVECGYAPIRDVNTGAARALGEILVRCTCMCFWQQLLLLLRGKLHVLLHVASAGTAYVVLRVPHGICSVYCCTPYMRAAYDNVSPLAAAAAAAAAAPHVSQVPTPT
jgi:hypothetical protein